MQLISSENTTITITCLLLGRQRFSGIEQQLRSGIALSLGALANPDSHPHCLNVGAPSQRKRTHRWENTPHGLRALVNRSERGSIVRCHLYYV